MEHIVKDSILAILDKIIEAIEKRDVFTLAKLSNYTIHNSSIFQDEDSLSIAIVTYSLSKIIDREKEIVSFFDQLTIKSFIINLKKMKEALLNNDSEKFRKKLGNIFSTIKRIDTKAKNYVQEVILKSKKKSKN